MQRFILLRFWFNINCMCLLKLLQCLFAFVHFLINRFDNICHLMRIIPFFYLYILAYSKIRFINFFVTNLPKFTCRSIDTASLFSYSQPSSLLNEILLVYLILNRLHSVLDLSTGLLSYQMANFVLFLFGVQDSSTSFLLVSNFLYKSYIKIKFRTY